MKSVTFKIKGLTPCIMHSGAMADPLNEYSKAMRDVSGKRKKTEDDHLEMARIEFIGSLYIEDNRVVWPSINLESMIIAAAKKSKQGSAAKAAIIVHESAPLEYAGPKDPAALFADKQFVDRRAVVVQMSRVMRTRPIFRQWGLTFTVSYHEDLLDEKDIRKFVEVAGREVGLSDFRPKFGQFVVV
jgi:hypothetical protein